MDTIPANAKKIGEIYAGSGEPPRMKTFFSKAVQVGGYVISILGGLFSQEFVSELFKENSAAYNKPTTGLMDAFRRGLTRFLYPELWKSNLANIGTFVAGAWLTEHVTKKIEHRTFRNHYGSSLPETALTSQERFVPVQSPESVTKASWQDKEAKRTETAQPNNVGLQP